MNLRQTVGRIAVLSGLLTSGVSALDFFAKPDEELKARSQIMNELEDKYGIHYSYGGGSAGGISFGYIAEEFDAELTADEKKRVREQYNQELQKKLEKVPVDEEARERSTRDGLGFVGGFGLAMMGPVIAGRGKERG